MITRSMHWCSLPPQRHRGKLSHRKGNLGGFYNFNEHLHFLFSAGDTLVGQRHTIAYLGLQRTW